MTQTTTHAPQQGITEALAHFIVNADARHFPESARLTAKHSLMDWAAVGIAGIDEPVSAIVRKMVLSESAQGPAAAFGLSHGLPMRAAALVNGATSHALDYDDTHFDYIGHPSVAIGSAALAMAQHLNASGRDLVDAFLIGVETACRVGRWLGMNHYQTGFHQTSSSGCFGAAAACARLMKLPQERVQHALGIAATRASGLKSQFGTMGKPYHAGMAASNGIEAVSLVALGFESRPDGLECEQGFGPTHAGENQALDVVLEGLGQVFRFEKIQYKYHACCHGTHASLEALRIIREIAAKSALGPEKINAINVTVHPRWLRVCDIKSPETGLQAKFSYRLTSAMMLAGINTGSLDTYTDEACQDQQLLPIRDQVNVLTDTALKDTESVVQVTYGQQTFTQQFDLDAPVDQDQQGDKLRAKAVGLLGQARANELFKVIDNLDNSSAASLAQIIAR